jgi:pyruvate formate lyase activating enzyme
MNDGDVMEREEPLGGWDMPVPLQEALADGKAECGVCVRRCRLKPGQRGFCGARENRYGRLVATSWGCVSVCEPRPMEIKPFFHYHPGAWALTFSSWGCNLDCQWCQNHSLSKEAIPKGTRVQEPELLLSEAACHDVGGVCVSFNEPATLFEYCLDLFPKARERGLFCCWVTNGVVTGDALRMLARAGLTGLTVSVKGDSEVYTRHCRLPGGDEAAWATIELARELGLHTETVYLMVTDTNDSDEAVGRVIRRHLEHAGEDAPLHFTRYHPDWRFHLPRTPAERVEGARQRALDGGVRFAYVGNLSGSAGENTCCPSCGELLMRRGFGRLVDSRLRDGDRCACGEGVPISREI